MMVIEVIGDVAAEGIHYFVLRLPHRISQEGTTRSMFEIRIDVIEIVVFLLSKSMYNRLRSVQM